MPHPATRFYGTHVLTPRPYAHHGYAGAAFKETVLGSKTFETGYLTGREADLLLARNAAKGLPVRVHEYGALSIPAPRRRTGSRLDAPTAPSRTLDLVVHPKKLTSRQYEDLKLIDRDESGVRVVRDEHGYAEAIETNLFRIPRVQTSILLTRGWISELPHSDRAWISSAGRMAMVWRWHQEQELNARLLKGLYLDAALTAAFTARASLTTG
ncbi:MULTISPECIES: hypothetical protein [unclassified Streptomyces]|uniref:hypothetical protein n=1 Tax=unclassified Streptomyces TaxID=2593676 RepID=UPI0033AED077